VIAAAALWAGTYRALERGLIGLGLLMSLSFLISAILGRPDLGAFVGGLVPKVPDGALLTAIALIGTTIVPYNLFLHAAAVRARWPEGGEAAVANALSDTRLSIGLGGVVSLLILSTAASALFQSGLEIRSAQDMAIALQPVAGDSARILIGVGLAAAGLTSAITAPMATAYAVSEVFGLKSRAAFRSIALTVLFVGTAIGLLGIRPVQLILVAQAANGLLLPIVAVFLLVAMNRTSLLGDHVNRPTDNLLGGLVVLVSCGLGLRLVLRAIGIWP
ncbi:MAG: divalent metal cation transporter, partial [Pseudomonadota bacterium]